jgi:methionyl aminopeptidase
MEQSIIKTKKQIQTMKKAGKHLAIIMNQLKDMSKPGIETMELEKHFLNYCNDHNIVPACKNYSSFGLPPFPTGLCISIDDQSVHCSPKPNQVLKNGQLLTIDTVIKYKDLYVDMAITVPVGKITKDQQKLLDVTEKAMYEAINKVRPGVTTGVISSTMFKTVKSNGYDVLRDYAGHGIGLTMHEPPNIPCYGNPNDGPKLQAGMTVCIEPLVTEGSYDLVHQENGWETKTKDGKNFVQFEHTVLVTETSYEILTKI